MTPADLVRLRLLDAPGRIPADLHAEMIAAYVRGLKGE